MENLQLSYPNYFLAFIAIIAVLYALSLYLNEKKLKENKAWLPALLGLLRWSAVMCILFLLLSPLLKIISSEKENPIVVIAHDISQSVENNSDTLELNTIKNSLIALKEDLKEDYTVDEIYFGQKVEKSRKDSLNDSSSNISSALEYISETYEDENLGSVILISDGIYNEGKNPIYSELELPVPIHTLAVGDTSLKRDIVIKNILHNRIVYLNDRFLLEADIQAYNAKGSKTKINVTKYQNGRNIVLESKEVIIDQERFFNTYRFELEADQVGNEKFLVSVDPITNELNSKNNKRQAYIEVLDARQKILLLCNSTHPDIKFLKNTIESNKNYELEIAFAEDGISNPSSYDVVILHSLPSSTQAISAELQIWNKNKTPLFFIIGSSIDRSAFNESQDILTLQAGNAQLNNVTAVKNPNFASYTNTEDFDQKIKNFVPLKAPFGDYELSPSSQTILYQKIGSVETSYPLLSYRDVNGHKKAVLAAEGLWKWSLMEYFDSEDNPVCKELIHKSIQYISQKDDKRQFRAFSNKKDYRENESILFDAQLYNDNYELINTPDASLVITNENNERFEYIFSKSEAYYVLNTGRFPEGNYNYTAEINYNNKRLTSSGKFSVQALALESFDLTARHDILLQLSQKFGGELLYANETQNLDSLIRNDANIRTIMYQKAKTESLMDWPWLLILALTLFTIEWFLRRYYGAY